jgi:DASS family divalent anion:Na+ symporter
METTRSFRRHDCWFDRATNPAPAMVLVGVSAIAIFQILPIEQALGGYADPIVWMVLAAFFISRGMMKTGLGRRIAFIFIKSIGRHSLGLTYALASTDALLATVIPSTGARSGGIVFRSRRVLLRPMNRDRAIPHAVWVRS